MSKKEYYYKGIYPVEIVLDGPEKSGSQQVRIKVKNRFLLASNYSEETRWVKPGEVFKVPATSVWSHKRKVAQGSLRTREISLRERFENLFWFFTRCECSTFCPYYRVGSECEVSHWVFGHSRCGKHRQYRRQIS